ncbi:MAG: hypothetical protein C0407_16205 [Desulfobacca sp.]|nr:hypothetical protein [Desulfobacca sp.]
MNTKLLIQDLPELKEAALEGDTRLPIDLPKLTLEGPKQIVLVPHDIADEASFILSTEDGAVTVEG